MAVSLKSQCKFINNPSSDALVRFYSYLLDYMEEKKLLNVECEHPGKTPKNKYSGYRVAPQISSSAQK